MHPATARVLIVVLAIMAFACAGNGVEQYQVSSTFPLYVDNQYSNALHVWTQQDGVRVRHLGVVDSYSKGIFLLHQADLISGSLGLVLINFLEGTAVPTDRITLSQGQEARLVIGPGRAQQFLYPYSKR